VVTHFPTNSAYAGGRDGDLTVKVVNAAFNQAFILAKHSPPALRPWRWLYLVLIGSVGSPGLLGCAAAIRRYGSPRREFDLLRQTWGAVREGWRAGRRCRAGPRDVTL
jgi:hypothetical protein